MMLGVWQLVLILCIVFVLFGAGKLPKVMGEVGRGIRNLKQGLQGIEEDKSEENNSKNIQIK